MALLPGSSRPSARRFAAACLVLALVAGRTARAQHGLLVDDPAWRLESSADGIALYSGSVREAGVVPLKAVMSIPGTIDEVALVLVDIPRRREWISNFDESVLLERTNDYEQTEYLRVFVPWPAQNRTAVIRARVAVSDDLSRAVIAAQSVDSHLADRLPKLVRAQIHASTFQMTQVGNHVEVVALVFIDPCGSIPKWIVNHFSRRAARATLVGLRRQVARKLYSPAQLAAMHRRIQGYRAFRDREGAVPWFQ